MGFLQRLCKGEVCFKLNVRICLNVQLGIFVKSVENYYVSSLGTL